MFIMLVVVIFTKSADQDEKPIDPKAAAQEIIRLEKEAQQLELKLSSVIAALSSLPTIGDPTLIEKWKVASKKLEASHERMQSEAEASQIIRKQLGASQGAKSELQEQKVAIEMSIDALAQARTSKRGAVQFIRLARLKWDSHPKFVQILCAGGRVSAANFTVKGQRIFEPNEVGTIVNDDKSAQQVFKQLFAGKSPNEYRVEVVVWPSGFAAYKKLEKVIIEAKFSINPIPVATGDSMGEEGPYRGVQ
ncbi:hypothetical protein LBMAG51_09340 [Phycisphaerae bacterium]|nr:hypothetical protein LBMAG51_09340 [Phycisphaerae bacterium]